MWVTVIKWLAQIFIVLVGIMALRWDPYATNPVTGKRSPTRAGWILVFSLTLGFLGFAASDFTERSASAERDRLQEKQIAGLQQLVKGQEKQETAQKEQISLTKRLDEAQNTQLSISRDLAELQQKQLSLANQLVESQNTQVKLSGTLVETQRRHTNVINKLGLDRNLSEIEISFTPSAEHWAKISKAYQKTKSPVPQASYSQAKMTAERVGNNWEIDFDDVSLPEGIVRFPRISTGTDQVNGKALEEVIREASIALWIRWGGGVQTEFQPVRGTYPSAVIVSQHEIAFIIRSPKISLNLNNLKAKPTVELRAGKKPPSSFTFRSLDPGVSLDQIITMNWEEKVDNSTLGKILPNITGPHHLDVTFKTISP